MQVRIHLRQIISFVIGFNVWFVKLYQNIQRAARNLCVKYNLRKLNIVNHNLRNLYEIFCKDLLSPYIHRSKAPDPLHARRELGSSG